MSNKIVTEEVLSKVTVVNFRIEGEDNKNEEKNF